MTSQEINPLFREKVKLEAALTTIRRAMNNSSLEDAKRSEEIREALSNVATLLPLEVPTSVPN